MRTTTIQVTNPNAAVAYLRVSTQEQATHGVSLDAQEARLRAYATCQGLDLVAIVRDEGVSAGKALSTRPGGQELLGLLAEGKAVHVLAVKLDRLFRDAADCLGQTKSWDAAGVALHLLDLSLNTASPMGRAFLTITATFAELERNLIAERTKTALQFKKSQGVRLGAPALGETEQEQAAVARIIELRHEEHTLREIAATLAAEGFTTKRGGTWAAETVRKVLARQGVA